MPKILITQMVPIAKIDPAETPDRFRPGDTGIDELAASIDAHGLLNPITLLPSDVDGRFTLVAGHRRLLAHIALGKTTIEAKVLAGAAEAVSELRLTENIQRQDLSPLEEAVAVKRWRDTAGITQEQAAEKLGRGLSWLKKRESLLSLQDDLMNAVHAGRISPSVAVSLKSIEDDQTRGYYIQTAEQYGCTQDVAQAWAQNYQRSVQPPSGQESTTSPTPNYPSPAGHMLPCHACQQTFEISTLRTVFLCSADLQALAGATRPKA